MRVRITNRDDPANVGLVEDEIDQLSHRFGAQTRALRLTGQREADLGLFAVRGNAHADITHQVVRLLIRDSELDPGSEREQLPIAHVLEELDRHILAGLPCAVQGLRLARRLSAPLHSTLTQESDKWPT